MPRAKTVKKTPAAASKSAAGKDKASAYTEADAIAQNNGLDESTAAKEKAATDKAAEEQALAEKAAAEKAAEEADVVNSEEEAADAVPTDAVDADAESHAAALADLEAVEIVVGRFYEYTKEDRTVVGSLVEVDRDVHVVENWRAGRSTGQLLRVSTTDNVTIRAISREQCYELSYSV